jgi:hypothetical protein
MLTKCDFCDYDTCVALKELGYNQSSIAFYPCQDIIVDCIDLNGELYEAEYDKYIIFCLNLMFGGVAGYDKLLLKLIIFCLSS